MSDLERSSMMARANSPAAELLGQFHWLKGMASLAFLLPWQLAPPDPHQIGKHRRCSIFLFF
jgi:hypothetical protein